MEFEFIKGYENLYKINKNGDIYSCHYKKNMKYLEKDDGYLYVDLRVDGKRHKCYIHRLLCIQYLPNPDNLPEVDHIDRNNRRNRADYCENLSDEQKEERKKKIRDYKAKWARENKLKQQIN
jgi:hypothetical protein